MPLLLGASRIDGPDACSKILLVGEMNPYGADAGYALYHEPSNAAGCRLQRNILGVDARRTYLSMWRTNLCVGTWRHEEATRRAALLVGADATWDVVVMLGAKVITAFGRVTPIGKLATFSTATRSYAGRALTFVALPHPSGRNTIWNNPLSVQRARSLLAAAAPAIHWGELDATAGET